MSEGKKRVRLYTKQCHRQTLNIQNIGILRELRKTLRYYKQVNAINEVVWLIILYNKIVETTRG